MRLHAPMLLRSARLPTSGDYAFEPKWDGFRCLASQNGRLRAVSRRGWDMTPLLPELGGLPDGLAVHGELVAFGDDGLPATVAASPDAESLACFVSKCEQIGARTKKRAPSEEDARQDFSA